MARIRTVKPEFWTSEQVLECSIHARLLFIGMWNFCDDCGNHPASIKTLKAEVFPADDIDLDSIRRMVVELSSNGLLVEYEHSGRRYWHVTGWHHQKIDKPSAKHPAYSDELRVQSPQAIDPKHNAETTLQNSTNGSRTLLDHSPLEGKGGEGKGKESSKTPVAPAYPDWLPLQAWSDYKEHRRAKRARFSTAKAEQVAIASLAKLRAEGNDPEAVLLQSIANGWTGIFALKKGQKPRAVDGIQEWLNDQGGNVYEAG